MAHVDDFLVQLVSPNLEPGETVMGAGLLRSPSHVNRLGIAENYASFLGVATDRRLVVFETDIEEFLKAKPKALPVARNPRVWRYDELQSVRVAPVKSVMFETRGAAAAMTLIPEIGCGPYAEEEEPGRPFGRHKRYDVFEEIGGLDGQARMSREFPSWLAQRVEARAFPMSPDRRAEVAAEIARRGAQRVADVADKARRSKHFWSEVVVPGLIIAVSLGLAGFGGVFVKGTVKSLSVRGDEITALEKEIVVRERDLATWLRDPKGVPPTDCPDKHWVSSAARGKAQRDCHMCHAWPKAKGAEAPPPHFRTFVRDGMPWACPDISSYEAVLKGAKRELGVAREVVDEAWLYLVVGIALVLAGVGVLVGGFFARSRMKRRAEARPAPA